MPVRSVNEARCECDERQNGDDFNQHHDVVGFRGLADSADQNHGEQHDDDERRPVEAEMPTGTVKHVAGEIGEAARQICRRDPFRIRMNAEPVQ